MIPFSNILSLRIALPYLLKLAHCPFNKPVHDMLLPAGHQLPHFLQQQQLLSNAEPLRGVICSTYSRKVRAPPDELIAFIACFAFHAVYWMSSRHHQQFSLHVTTESTEGRLGWRIQPSEVLLTFSYSEALR